jgi:Na+/H+ antiporter NhaD/arsenite permease-like protein
MTLALIIFIATYILMLAFPRRRHIFAVTAGGLFLILGVLTPMQALTAVDFNIIMMLAGTMTLVTLFIDSGMPLRLADKLMAKMPDIRWAVVSLALFAGFVSAFIDNVATLLIVAPIGIAVSKRLGVSPVPVILTVAVHSNLQGAATLVGDTTSILLGGHAGMDFLDFFVYKGRASIFWAVELGAAVTVPALMYIFRAGARKRVPPPQPAPVNDYFPGYMLVALVAALICASFVPGKPQVTNGLICLALGAAGVVRAAIRGGVGGGRSVVIKALREIDYVTLVLLAGLFVVIEGIRQAGVIDEISKIFVTLSGDSLFTAYTLIVLGSVLLSAFIDNIPYVATMLPVVALVAASLETDPTVLYFGLLSGATLGGNLTPIGASTNIAATGILRREGHTVSVVEYMRIGLPITLSALTAGYVFVWLVWR